jgi:hypothetical protein
LGTQQEKAGNLERKGRSQRFFIAVENTGQLAYRTPIKHYAEVVLYTG